MYKHYETDKAMTEQVMAECYPFKVIDEKTGKKWAQVDSVETGEKYIADTMVSWKKNGYSDIPLKLIVKPVR